MIRSISGVYGGEVVTTSRGGRVRERTGSVRRDPRSTATNMVAKMGQDGHDRGQKVVSTAYADMGFDVDVGPLFQTPEETAKQAVENDVHVVGVSSLAAGHLTLVPALKRHWRPGTPRYHGRRRRRIPPQDYEALRAAGATEIFGPGTVIGEAGEKIMGHLEAGPVVM